MADDDKTRRSDASGSSEGGSTSGSGEGTGSSSSSDGGVAEKPTPLIPDGNIESYTNMYRFAEAVNDLMTNGKTARRLRSDPSTSADMECFTPGHTLHLSDLINVVQKYQGLFHFSKRMSTNELVSLYNYGKTIAREGRKFPSTDDVNEAVKSYEDKKQLAIVDAENNYREKCKGYNESRKGQSKAGWKVFGHTFGLIGSGALALTVPAAVFGGIVALVTVPSVALSWMTGGSIALFAGAIVAVKYVMPKCFQLFGKVFGKLKDAIKAHKEAKKCAKESRLIRNDARAQYSACQNQYVIDNNLSSISTKCYPGHVRADESARTAEADPVLVPTGYERVSDARTSSAPASEAGVTTAPVVEAERTIETPEGASGTAGATSTATAGTESTSSVGGTTATATAGTGSVSATPETASESVGATSTATAETGSSEATSDKETAELTADESAIWRDFEKLYESVDDKSRFVEESAFINTAKGKGIEEERAKEIFNIKRPETKSASVPPTGGNGGTTSDLTIEAELEKPQTQTKPVPPTGGNGGGNNNHDDEDEHENDGNGGNDGGGSGGNNGGNDGGSNEGEEEAENTQTPESDAKAPKHDCPYLAIQCFDSIEGTPTEEQINAIYARTGYKSLDDAKAKYAKNKKISVEEIDLDPKEGKKPNRPWLAKTIAEVVGKDNLSKTYETRTGYSDPEVAKQVYAKQRFRKANKEVLTSLGASSWKELSSKSEEDTERLWENLDKKQKDNLLNTVKDLSDEDAEALLRDIPESIVKGVRSRLEQEQIVEEEYDSTSTEEREVAPEESDVSAENSETALEEPVEPSEPVVEEKQQAEEDRSVEEQIANWEQEILDIESEIEAYKEQLASVKAEKSSSFTNNGQYYGYDEKSTKFVYRDVDREIGRDSTLSAEEKEKIKAEILEYNKSYDDLTAEERSIEKVIREKTKDRDDASFIVEGLKAKSVESSEPVVEDLAESGDKTIPSAEDDVYERFSRVSERVTFASEEMRLKAFKTFAERDGRLSPERAEEVYVERSDKHETESEKPAETDKSKTTSQTQNNKGNSQPEEDGPEPGDE